jgi:hypothetical protein
VRRRRQVGKIIIGAVLIVAVSSRLSHSSRAAGDGHPADLLDGRVAHDCGISELQLLMKAPTTDKSSTRRRPNISANKNTSRSAR